MRAPSDMPRPPRRPSGRGRVAMLVTLAVVFVLFTLSSEIATFYTDRLWFDSVDLVEVWSGVIGAKFQLVAIFTVLLTAGLWFNLFIADRRAPALSAFGPGEDVFGRYQEMLDRRAGVVRGAVALGFGIIGGMNMSGQWQQWLLFRNGGDFGRTDATFGEDIGFYVFKLPFLNTLVSWGFGWGCIALMITGVAYYLNGGIRPQAPVERVSMAAKRHLALILVFIVVTKSADYWLQHYELVFSNRGIVNGATYAAINAELPALKLLVAASLVTAALVVYSVFRRGFTLPVVSVCGWFLVSIVAGVAYPAWVQATEVKPNESQKEREYIVNNMAATRDALGLTKDKIEVRPYAYDDSEAAAAAAIEANQATIRNVAIIDPDRVLRSFQNQQGTQNFYKFGDLDIDRYPIRLENGEQVTAAMVLGTRDIVYKEAPQGWENQTVVYTHGYGAALSAASGVGQGGNPDYLVKGIPVTVDGRLDLRGSQAGTAASETDDAAPQFEPSMYFGQLEDDKYVVVGATKDELAYINGANSVNGRYAGKGGVPLDNVLTRVAYSLRFKDTQMLLSSYITEESRLLFIRDVGKRLQMAAPFITWDADPYPVIADGRVVYMVDGYTTTDRFPNAQQVNWEGAESARPRFNYVRNSVKATVDAFDGSVRLYVWDPNDPILRAYASAFPSLFHKVDDMPADVLAHVRYPKELFKVQTGQWGRYRLDKSDAFYSSSGAWSVAQRPPDQPQDVVTASRTPAAGQGGATAPSSNPIDPYYSLLKLPNDPDESFNLLRTFVPVGAGTSGPDGGVQNLSGFMFARSDPGNYGKLVVYEMPEGSQVNGPKLVDAKIATDQEVTSLVTLLDQRGSTVDWGAMLMVPVGDGSLIWVRPMYVNPQGKNNPQAVPVLANVVVVFGDEVVMKPTLREALREIFGADLQVSTFETGGGVGEAAAPGGTTPGSSSGTSVPTTSGTGGSSTSTTAEGTGTTVANVPGTETVEQLLDDAARLLREADEAYEKKDLTRYIELVDEARAKVDEAAALSARSSPATTSTSPQGGSPPGSTVTGAESTTTTTLAPA